QRLEEGDESAFVFWREIESEFMAGYGASRYAHAGKSGRLIVRTETARIEAIFQAGHRGIVAVQSSIPDSFQRRNLVKSRSLSSLQREAGIGLNGDRKDVCAKGMISRRFKTFRKRQLVVCV